MHCRPDWSYFVFTVSLQALPDWLELLLSNWPGPAQVTYCMHCRPDWSFCFGLPVNQLFCFYWKLLLWPGPARVCMHCRPDWSFCFGLPGPSLHALLARLCFGLPPPPKFAYITMTKGNFLRPGITWALVSCSSPSSAALGFSPLQFLTPRMVYSMLQSQYGPLKKFAVLFFTPC